VGCALAVILCAVALFTGCGGSGSRGAEPLQVDQLNALLQDLPYVTRVREIPAPAGDDDAFEVVAKRGHLTVHLTAAVGDPPLPVELPGPGPSGEIGIPSLELAFDSDTNDVHRFKTHRESIEAVNMAVDIEERICRKVSGEPCPV
jgi:hypothetical protein